MSTKIKAELILASKNVDTGDILYSFRLTYPRIILAEFNTHRAFSRNTSSSRAIPGKKQRRVVREDPFVPTHIGALQKGMQAGAELTGWRRAGVEFIWKAARWPNLIAAWAIEKLGAHKQIGNRLLEPWMWVTQVSSMTDINNFLLLRAHEMAEPHFNELAQQMKFWVEETGRVFEEMEIWSDKTYGTKYQRLLPGEWHLPFIDVPNEWMYTLEDQKLMSAARCARTSFTVVGEDKTPSPARDRRLGYDLVNQTPLHASPLEHQAEAMSELDGADRGNRYANYSGFRQYRTTLPGERGGD